MPARWAREQGGRRVTAKRLTNQAASPMWARLEPAGAQMQSIKQLLNVHHSSSLGKLSSSSSFEPSSSSPGGQAASPFASPRSRGGGRATNERDAGALPPQRAS